MASLHWMQRVTRKRWTRRASQRINITFPTGRHHPPQTKWAGWSKGSAAAAQSLSMHWPMFAFHQHLNGKWIWESDWMYQHAQPNTISGQKNKRTPLSPSLSLFLVISININFMNLKWQFTSICKFAGQLHWMRDILSPVPWTGLDWSVSGDWWWTSEWTHTI